MQIKLIRPVFFGILLFIVVITAGISSAEEVDFTLMGSYPISSTWNVAVSGNYAYVAGSYNGLVILDISNPATPTLKSSIQIPVEDVLDVAASGNYAYVVGGNAYVNGLYIVDISNPAAPTIKGSYNTHYRVRSVAVSGNYAYLGSGTEFLIINISDPVNPTLVGYYRHPSPTYFDAFGVTVSGNYAYVAADHGGLFIIDISNPAAPTLVGFYDTEYAAREVAVSGNYAYVAETHHGLLILDISNPSSPTPVGLYAAQDAVYGVTVSGNYAYMADYYNGLVAVNIRNPTTPLRAGWYNTPGSAMASFLVGNYIYVADGHRGIIILRVGTNSLPVANAGDSYQTTEGSAIRFDASASSDPDGDALQYRWDFESDGTWDTEWSDAPTATHTWNDDGIDTVTLEVRDDEFTSSDTADVTVTNVNPVIEAGNDQIVNEGTEVILSGSYTDTGIDDTHTITWNFGDGETASDTLTPTHVYTDNGEYTVTLTVTDDDGGVGSDTLIVTVNNINPVVGDIISPLDPHEVNTPVASSSTFTDAGILDTHTSVWDWGDGTTSAGIVAETNGAGTVTGEHAYSNAGIYWVTLTVTDDDGGSASIISEYYVVTYDPEGGFVTGGGWIDSPVGAYVLDTTLEGKATFGFVSKYQKGATVPSGNTEFQFKVADLNFKSTSYDWLVVAGPQSKYKGTGTINEAGEYGFMLSAVDGAITGDNIDKFRIKIWDKASGDIVYDNEVGVSEDVAPSTAIGGGSVVIHKTK